MDDQRVWHVVQQALHKSDRERVSSPLILFFAGYKAKSEYEVLKIASDPHFMENLMLWFVQVHLAILWKERIRPI